jgi:hypothetical protein
MAVSRSHIQGKSTPSAHSALPNCHCCKSVITKIRLVILQAARLSREYLSPAGGLDKYLPKQYEVCLTAAGINHIFILSFEGHMVIQKGGA